MTQVTRLLNAIDRGDQSAAEELLPLVYQELRRLAAMKLANEGSINSLRPTVLVHDAHVRLVECNERHDWNGRGHFFAAAAEAMRRLLIEGARKRSRQKHGGDFRRVELTDLESATGTDDVDLLALDEVLLQLEDRWPEKARLVKLRFSAGLTIPEAAQAMGISHATAERHWAFARTWLYQQLLADGDVDQALQAIRKTSLQRTPVWSVYHRIGQAYVEAGESDKALAVLRRADIKNPIYLSFHRDIALILYEKDQLDKAIAEMRRALDGTIVSPRYPGELAWFLLLLKDDSGNLTHLDEAAQCGEIARRTAAKNLSDPHMDSPLNASAFTALGMVHYCQGNWKEALADLQTSHDHKYEGIDNLIFLAMTHWQLGDQDKAQQWYDQAAAFKQQHKLNRAEREYFEAATMLIGR